MNPHKKVASLFLKQSSQITFKESSSWDFDSDSLVYVMEAYSKGELIGEFGATLHLVDQKNFDSYTCREEMRELVTQNPSLVNSDNKVYVAEVVNSMLYDDFRGLGWGVKGYLRLAQHLFQKKTNRTPFLFIPNYCNKNSTSPEAIRVWQSLSRKYPSKREVVVIN